MNNILNSLIQQTIEITELLKKLAEKSFDSSDDELDSEVYGNQTLAQESSTQHLNLQQRPLEQQPRQDIQETSFLKKRTTPTILGALSVKGIQRKKLFKNKPPEVRLLEQFQQALKLNQKEQLHNKLTSNTNDPTKLTFKCNYCDMEFLRQKEIISHMNDFHDLQINNIEIV